MENIVIMYLLLLIDTTYLELLWAYSVQLPELWEVQARYYVQTGYERNICLYFESHSSWILSNLTLFYMFILFVVWNILFHKDICKWNNNLPHLERLAE